MASPPVRAAAGATRTAPGVVLNFAAALGTGGGSTAQDLPELGFPAICGRVRPRRDAANAGICVLLPNPAEWWRGAIRVMLAA